MSRLTRVTQIRQADRKSNPATTSLSSQSAKNRKGKVKYALLGWLFGLPIPIILILLFVRGCDF